MERKIVFNALEDWPDMPEDYTCSCGLYVHPQRANPKAIHAADCPYRKAKRPKGDFFKIAEQGYSPRKHRARWNGEFRPPKKGEWYLSGAEPQAWQAPNDLDTPFFIARIVPIEIKIIISEVIYEG